MRVESFCLTDLRSESPVTHGRSAQGRACPWQGFVAVIVLAGLLTPATKAFALWDDKLALFAEEKATHDDNVFRISKDVDPATIGASSRGDTYRTTSLGFNFDVPASRQRFQGGYTWNATRYNQFTDLDSDGHDARATWLWQLGNDASGQLGYTETFALASFAFIQSATPDPLRTRQAFFNAAYLVTPRWRLQAGVRGLEQTNGDPQRQKFDVNVRYTDVTVSYVTPANTSVGLSGRTEDGRFPNPGGTADNAYRQDSVGIVADWTLTGVSHLSARADRVRRRYGQVPQQDFDGNTVRAQYDSKPTGKFSLTAVVQRDIYPYLDIGSSFVLVKGVTLRPTLSLTEKLDVSGTFDYGIRDFLGNPGLASGVSPSRTDRVRSATATVSYRPARTITLLMSAQREARSSNVVPNPAATPAVLPVDYVVNVISITARIAF
jgi:exopolysaccharide biosynthesis operon protein EpsL